MNGSGGALRLAGTAPSAVNKQPWRAVIAGDDVHFYEQHSKGFGSEAWDIQKIDLGIAMCHFAAGMEELGKALSFRVEDPGISAPEGCEYVATFRLG